MRKRPVAPPPTVEHTYEETREAIAAACAKISLSGSPAEHSDGRIVSAVNEKKYLDALRAELPATFRVDVPKDRAWYDIMINGTPINLKITTGRTDNAFNKRAVLSAISTETDGIDQNTNWKNFYRCVKEAPRKPSRNRQTEYHYLVLHKKTGSVLFKSILDIHTYKSNPSNIMQINWNNEFAHEDDVTPEENTGEKIRALLKIIQKSLREWTESSRPLVEADIDADFP